LVWQQHSIPLLDDPHAPPVAGKVGRPRRTPDLVLLDCGYDHDKCWSRPHRRAEGATEGADPPRTASLSQASPIFKTGWRM
jgi:hypothetical protein